MVLFLGEFCGVVQSLNFLFGTPQTFSVRRCEFLGSLDSPRVF